MKPSACAICVYRYAYVQLFYKYIYIYIINYILYILHCTYITRYIKVWNEYVEWIKTLLKLNSYSYYIDNNTYIINFESYN